MKLGFICLCVPGHFYPMSTLARQLQARNHEVVMFSLPIIEPLVRAGGLEFVPYGSKEFTNPKSLEIIGALSRLRGEEGLQFTVDVMAAMLKVKWKELPKLLSAHGIDALVLDNYEFYGEVIPKSLEMPYTTISGALHFDYSGYTPLCVYGWAHENTPAGVERNRQGVSKFTQMLIRSNAETIAEVERAGIKPNWEDPSSLFSDLPWITQCPREFDFENAHWPEQFQYTGPFHDGKGRPELDFPWDRLTGEPIVYASMGTVQTGNSEVFRTIVAAVSKHQGLQLVLSIGNVLQPEHVGPVPNNAIVVNNAPQLELLKKAAVCVTHAGFNTVLEALTQGVPQLAIPITNDQPGVAARIADKRTGVVTSFDQLNASHLSTLLGEVLKNPVYRGNAGKLQQAIAETNGLSRAADLLEKALGLTKTVRQSNTKLLADRQSHNKHVTRRY